MRERLKNPAFKRAWEESEVEYNIAKQLPKFKSEKQERAFWLSHDSTDYIDWDEAFKNPKMPNLKPSTKSVSIRLPVSLIESLKLLANKRDVPYQSLLKAFLAEKVKEEYC